MTSSDLSAPEAGTALHVLPGARRTRRDASGTESWALSPALSWKLSSVEAKVLRQFQHPCVAEALTETVTEEHRDALDEVIGSLVTRGLLVGLDLGGGAAPYAAGLFQAPILPWEVALARRPDIAVLGAPYDVGVTFRPGARFGTEYLRRCSSAVFGYREEEGRPVGMHDVVTGRRVLEGRRIVDLGDINRTVMTRNGDVFDDIDEVVGRIATHNALPVLLGGDHSVAYPAIRGLAKMHEGLVVVHVDAHHDFGRARTDDHRSDLHHGNFLDWVVGDERVSRVVQLGLRQLTPEAPQEHPRLVRLPGRSAIGGDVLQHIPADAPVHVTLDVDVLDPAVLPSTGTRLPGGWSYEDLLATLEPIMRGRRVVGLDVTELCGSDDERSGLVVAGAIIRLLDAWSMGGAW